MDIVCLSSQDWDDLWTRKQRFMQRFARQGNRVLYVETQASLASVGILRADWRRAFRWLAGPRQIERNLYVATLPLVLPFFQMSTGINTLNNLFLRPLLRHWIKLMGFQDPILWTYNPYSESLVGKLGERFAIYECVDELSAAKGLVRKEVVREQERRLMEKVQMMIVTHDNLYRSKQAKTHNIHLIPNGAEVEHFKKVSLSETPIAQELQTIPRPIIGFLGSVQYWLDFDLLRFLALARPQWSFLFVGPIGRLAQAEKIQALPNVYLLGRKPYDDLPSYLKGFDVCLNPYLTDDTALNCSPLKLYEYLASGKPIVSVDMPEVRKFNGMVRIGRNYQELLCLLDETVKPGADNQESSLARIQAVEPHSWDHRFRHLETVLAQHIGR